MGRRGRMLLVVALTVVLLVAAGTVTALRQREDCGTDVRRVASARATSPFLDAGRRARQPDPQRDTLVRAMGEAPAPFGPVLGAFGYPYGQGTQLSALAGGLGVRTRDDPVVTLLDDSTLRPRWGLEVRTRRSTYDTSERSRLVVTLPRDAGAHAVDLDAGSGRRRWCAPLAGPPPGAHDVVTTQFLSGDDVVVGTGGSARRERLVRLGHRDGSAVWRRRVAAGAGDFLGDLGSGVLVVGGSPAYALTDRRTLARQPLRTTLVAVSQRDGRTLWDHAEPAGSDVHVVGTDPESGSVVLLQQSARAASERLVTLDRSGHVRWSAVPSRGTYVDAALRAGRVLVRAGTRWAAYDVNDGRVLWRRTFPDRPQLLPYGFELESIPLLDADHALLGTTTALRTLDLRDGSTPVSASAPLPRDGINTTYWPYQVVVTERLIAVATNVGAVVVRRN